MGVGSQWRVTSEVNYKRSEGANADFTRAAMRAHAAAESPEWRGMR